MIISPFTPLFFDLHKSDGIDSRYIQLFAPTDRILVEVIRTVNENTPVAVLRNHISGVEQHILWNSWQMNDTDILDFHEITGLSDGCYSLTIGDKESRHFRVTSVVEDLNATTLIQYCMKNNKQRQDVVSWIDGMQYFFDFRVPGGFKDKGWSFGVDNEQFVTDLSDIIELYATDSTIKTFTMGTNIGCPIWFAELLNRLLCCSYVYFDGVRYARKDTSVPELNEQMEGLNSFVFNQQLQKVNNINATIENANQAIIRRVSSEYRSTETDTDNMNLLIN
ncbi:MAG: hypothetical protein E7080_05980 [Bacteroidales bacterium]|nr:hypothetical protein [Bacteroidales bacterium]